MKAYIFDIDDTLYLERDYVRSGFNAVGMSLGCPKFGRRCQELFESGVRGNTFDLAKAEFPQIDAPVSELVQIYRAHAPQISLCDDAREFIFNLRARTGVISDGPVLSQRAKFRALGLHPWIDCPIFTHETCAPKPAQAPFQLAAFALNTDYPDCIYFGDNPQKDFAGAKSLGMHTVRLRRPHSLHEHVDSGPDVDREIADFTQFRD